jgi:hypothetical protein
MAVHSGLIHVNFTDRPIANLLDPRAEITHNLWKSFQAQKRVTLVGVIKSHTLPWTSVN